MGINSMPVRFRPPFGHSDKGRGEFALAAPLTCTRTPSRREAYTWSRWKAKAPMRLASLPYLQVTISGLENGRYGWIS